MKVVFFLVFSSVCVGDKVMRAIRVACAITFPKKLKGLARKSHGDYDNRKLRPPSIHRENGGDGFYFKFSLLLVRSHNII